MATTTRTCSPNGTSGWASGQLKLVPLDGESERYDLRENGVSLLPDSVAVDAYPDRVGDALWFLCSHQTSTDTYYIAAPAGDRTVTLPVANY